MSDSAKRSPERGTSRRRKPVKDAGKKKRTAKRLSMLLIFVTAVKRYSVSGAAGFLRFGAGRIYGAAEDRR